MLEARGIRYLRDGQLILDGVDLTVSAGESLAVTGPSGSGKTSLLAIISGLAAPAGGDVYLDGTRLARFAGPSAGVALVLQGYGLVSLLTAAENIEVALRAAGLPDQETALAFSLIYDYTLGFALSDRTTVNEQRVQDTATRHQLHAFFRSLPADRFPALAALGEHIWADNRDERFTASLDTLLSGIQAARHTGCPNQAGARPRRQLRTRSRRPAAPPHRGPAAGIWPTS